MSRQKLCWLQILEVRMHTKLWLYFLELRPFLTFWGWGRLDWCESLLVQKCLNFTEYCECVYI